jgi:hypothetical protein
MDTNSSRKAVSDNTTMERRQEPRDPADQPVEVRILAGSGRTLHAHIVDVSPSGLRIRFDRPISEGTRLNLDVGDESVYGLVRYCIPVGGEFDAGVLIEYVVRPEHITP